MSKGITRKLTWAFGEDFGQIYLVRIELKFSKTIYSSPRLPPRPISPRTRRHASHFLRGSAIEGVAAIPATAVVDVAVEHGGAVAKVTQGLVA